VPFLRYTRDKRGYETTYVMHNYRSSQGGGGDARVLYLFRSPAHVTVGRRPLDDEARAGLEHTHPDLSFDWQSLVKEASVARPAASPRTQGREPKGSRPTASAPVVVVQDETILARVLGAGEAARLRSRYGELLQRITRRSRSPEERDQLLERLRRLNPDDWGNESLVRAGVSTVEAEWDAIAAALPARRRGRRGGRRRDETTASQALPTSGIIAEDGEADARQEDPEMDRANRTAGDTGDDDRVGRPGAGDSIPGDD
jgi:hypothetical protein